MKLKLTGGQLAVLGTLLTALGTGAAFLTIPECRSTLGLHAAENREERIRLHLLEYLSSSDTTLTAAVKSPEAIADYFRFPINNYYGERNINRKRLIERVSEYHERWPHRSFNMIEEPNVLSTEKKREGIQCLVQSSFAYEVMRDVEGVPEIKSGHKHLRIEVLERPNKSLEILSVYEFKPKA